MAKDEKQIKPLIIRLLKQGETIISAVDKAKISRRTYYYWLENDEDFERQVRNAKIQAMLEES